MCPVPVYTVNDNNKKKTMESKVRTRNTLKQRLLFAAHIHTFAFINSICCRFVFVRAKYTKTSNRPSTRTVKMRVKITLKNATTQSSSDVWYRLNMRAWSKQRKNRDLQKNSLQNCVYISSRGNQTLNTHRTGDWEFNTQSESEQKKSKQ